VANSAAGAAAVSAPQQAGSSGAQNPFQIATNLYAEQNVQAQFNGQIPTSASQQGGSVNAGQYLRGVRLILRTTTVASGYSECRPG
jgi:4-diphosphocytidyl-2C-methyl-D-erythritol kinase